MSKKQTNIIKGIAIIMMVFHHLFVKDERYELYNLTWLIINKRITIIIADECKLCVTLFALLSGYGLRKKFQLKNTESNAQYYEESTLYSYASLVKDSCLLMIELLVLSYFFGYNRTPQQLWGDSNTIVGIINNMLGISGFFNKIWYINSWWYLTVAILFVLLFPLLNELMEKCGIVFVLCFSIIFLPVIFKVNMSSDFIYKYLPAFISGMVFCKKEVFETIDSWINRNIYLRIFGSASLILLCVLTTIISRTTGSYFLTHTIEALAVCILSNVVVSKNKYVENILGLLGENSKYMWLLHTYIYANLFRKFIFSLNNIWFILTTTLILSLLLSFGLKRINHFIFDQLYRLKLNISKTMSN